MLRFDKQVFVTVLSYTFGLVCGIILSTYLQPNCDNAPFISPYEPVINGQPVKSIGHTDFIHYDFRNSGHTGESIIADAVANMVRVCCWIVTMPENHGTKATSVKNTWAQRCNHYIFVSSIEDSNLPSIAAVKTEGRNELWNKTAAAILYSYKNQIDKCDFFLKADDDTYVIVENLRHLLLNYNAKEPMIMGRKFRVIVKQGYASGGGGYVISRAGLELMAKGIMENKGECRVQGGAEDVNAGACAGENGLRFVDSRDSSGLERFHPFPPSSMLNDDYLKSMEWFVKYNYHRIRGGVECCSDYAATFHYISPKDMYVLDYLIYHLHPYGVHRDFSDVLALVQSRGLNMTQLRLINQYTSAPIDENKL